MSDQHSGPEKETSKTNPEERWPDPESELPTVPEPPSPSPPSASEASKPVAVAFWKSVLVVNVALFAVCFGPMLMYFRGQTMVGAGIFVSGLVAFGYAYFIYWAFRRSNRGDGKRHETKE